MNSHQHPREADYKIIHAKLIPRCAGTDGRAKPFHALSITALLVLFLAATSVFAGSATWAPSSGATVGDWNRVNNWSPQTVPNGFSDVATFAHSFTTGVFISSSAVVNGITFASSMFPSAYTISTTPDGFLQIVDAGITNDSGLTQNFVSDTEPISFFRSATPGSFTILTARASTTNSAAGGSIAFWETSSAGSATLIANGGTFVTNSGALFFNADSTGGTSRIELLGLGHLDISAHVTPSVSVGSIEGDGYILLGARNLNVGSNNKSTVFSGLIADRLSNGGSTGGSLTKTGNSKLTLTKASAYTGGTTVNKGTLLVKNTSGSATGSGAVLVDGGTLEGTGKIDGAVTVGTGVGTTSRATLLAGNGATSPGTLTINKSVTFQSDSTYKCVLNRSTGKASKVTASGVTINNSAQFAFTEIGSGTLTVGTVFRVIDNTSAQAISGRFRNLSNGLILTSPDGTKLKVNYTGGTGNDLTLKVVP